jgi:hypothetical protein
MTAQGDGRTPLSEKAGMRAILPIGRSGYAIAAGYLGIFSVIPFVGPVAILFGILAIRHIKKNPQRHGMGRAIFGIAMGAALSILYGVVFIASAAG